MGNLVSTGSILHKNWEKCKAYNDFTYITSINLRLAWALNVSFVAEIIIFISNGSFFWKKERLKSENHEFCFHFWHCLYTYKWENHLSLKLTGTMCTQMSHIVIEFKWFHSKTHDPCMERNQALWKHTLMINTYYREFSILTIGKEIMHSLALVFFLNRTIWHNK